jgi:hypothetical protein
MTTIVLGTQRGLRIVGESGDPVHGADVTALSRGHETVWAIIDGHELTRITPQGAERIAHLDPAATCLLAADDTVWVGTEQAHLFRLDGSELRPLAEFDAAPSRAEWYTPWGGPADTRSLAAGAGRVYVNVHVGGILISDDDGASWESTLDLHTDGHQVSLDDDGIVWAATGAAGLGESRDGGQSWTFHTAGLHGTYLRCAVPTDDGVLVTASSGPHAHDGAVYRFDHETFHSCDGLPERFGGNLDTGALASSGKTAALAGIDGRLYVSDDGGRSWTVAATDLPPVREVVCG